ncbi:DUF2270 domain-containing protein [Halostella sp. JP-L12]|uniref:DUF2270 domain-containing protein n=1 Tax=Halostella TaxID=1843185 RepID=UPI000EF818A6|nr:MULTISPECIES: DUF2270 domain-containing protein [Halostella]NHN48302.1 DUF2270 domain-containing protein [Halostella sp. JP-L12]
MAESDSERASDAADEADLGISDDRTAFAGLTGEFYRGEVDRTASWRARLDQTTNWAVVVVAAILTWAFSSPDNPHYVMIIGMFGVTAFLIMEATRYREYDVWRNRVRILQKDLYAEMYSPDQTVLSTSDRDWREQLSEELGEPTFNISFREALTHRLRRSYLPLLLILLAAWVARVTVFEPSESWQQTASMVVVPGEVVVAVVGVFYAVVILVTAWSARGKRVREFQE